MTRSHPVTIIIPAYNALPALARTLESTGHLADPGSVIVVDDGSTDGTPEAARSFGARVLAQPNRGPATARNAALDAAPTDRPVIFLDADDRLLPDATALLDAARDNPDRSCVVGAHAQLDRGSRTLRTPDPAWIARTELVDPAVVLATHHIFCTSGLLLTPRALAHGLRFDTERRFAEDRDLIYRAASIGPVGITDALIIEKHASDSQMTADPSLVERWLCDQLTLCDKHDADPPARNALEPATRWVLKHAARRLAERGRTLDPALLDHAKRVFARNGWKLPASLLRIRVVAQLRSIFTRPA